MKRLLPIVMLLLLLAGCARTGEAPPKEPDPPRAADPAPEQTPAEGLTAPEENAPETDPVSETAPATQPETVPASKPETKPVSQPATAEPASQSAEKPKVDPAASEALMLRAADLYRAITEDKVFTVQVTEPNGTVTELTVTPGEGDWNVLHREYGMQSYDWTIASVEDWQTLMASQNRGMLLRFVGTEGQSLAFCEGGDVVELVQDGMTDYYLAVNPREGELFEVKLYGLLDCIAQDALRDTVWRVTVDGSLSPQEAAERMVHQIAENLRNAPDWANRKPDVNNTHWAEWKPLDAQVGDVSVFDRYLGQPEEFCCSMSLKLRFDDSMTGPAQYWQASAGLSELEETGWYGCANEVRVKKNDAGDWVYMDRSSGGASVRSSFWYGDASLSQLVELFCLTEGRTHDWLAPYEILERSPEELADLPALLDQLTEGEGRELCAVLGRCLREYDYWNHSVETLKPLLGVYGDWLDA